jgi:Rieske Fe-S protein
MNQTRPDHSADTSAPATCVGCGHLDRRRFLTTASMLSIGALLAACGDGVLDGPAAFPTLLTEPVRINLVDYPALSQVGGRAIITPFGHAPVLVERLASRQFRALSLVCPHNGTVVDTTSEGFVCPNHHARFATDGRWIGGTPTVDLTPVAVAEVASGNATVALMVGGVVVPPALSVTPASVVFSTTNTGGALAPQTVALANVGGGTLTGLTVSLAYGANQPTGWLSPALSSITAPATLSLSATRGTLPLGTYSARVTVSGLDTSIAPQTVAVVLNVVDSTAPPSIQLSATTLALNSSIGSSPAAQTVQVTNGGGGTLGALSVAISYGAGATGWLSTSSLSGLSTPSTLTVRPVSTALTVGNYTATITISGAGVASRTVTVTLSVIGAGLAVTIASWPALASVGGVAGSVGTVSGSPVAVVRTGANTFAAFSLRCPHQGTTVQVQNGTSFRCPNHGALWSANGALQPNSPLRTSSLTPRNVSYVAGDSVLFIT